jgi:hypothetical protein
MRKRGGAKSASNKSHVSEQPTRKNPPRYADTPAKLHGTFLGRKSLPGTNRFLQGRTNFMGVSQAVKDIGSKLNIGSIVKNANPNSFGSQLARSAVLGPSSFAPSLFKKPKAPEVVRDYTQPPPQKPVIPGHQKPIGTDSMNTKDMLAALDEGGRRRRTRRKSRKNRK